MHDVQYPVIDEEIYIEFPDFPRPTWQGRREIVEQRDGGNFSVYEWVVFDLQKVKNYFGGNHIGGNYYRWDNENFIKDLPQLLTGWCYEYDAPGCWFWHSPSMRITRSRILIQRSGSYDI